MCFACPKAILSLFSPLTNVYAHSVELQRAHTWGGSAVHRQMLQKRFTSAQVQLGFVVVGEVKAHCLERYSFGMWNKRTAELLAVFCSGAFRQVL